MSDSTPTVIRSPKGVRSRFARIDNDVLQDHRLSFRARGIIAYILSKPTTWRHSADDLSCASSEGLHAIRTALAELRDLGYARLEKTRDRSGRVFHRWVFCESPSTENRETASGGPSIDNPHSAPSTDLPCSVKPKRGEPHSGEPSLGKTAMFETTGSETTVNETTVGETTDAPAALVSFPWQTIADLPPDLQKRLRSAYPFDEDADDVFRAIRGRKLKFKDRHSTGDWVDVMLVEIDQESATDKSAGRGQSRLYRRRGCDAGDWNGIAAPSNPPAPTSQASDGPAGWREFLAAESPPVYGPGGSKAALRWHDLDHDVRAYVQREMPRPAGSATRSATQ